MFQSYCYFGAKCLPKFHFHPTQILVAATPHISFALGLVWLYFIIGGRFLNHIRSSKPSFSLMLEKKPWSRQTDIQTEIQTEILYSEHSLRRGNITGVFCQLVWWRKNFEGLYKYIYAAILPACSLCSKSTKSKAKFRVLTWRLTFGWRWRKT